MDFEQRFCVILKESGVPKKEVARKIGVPYSTFLYKAKHLEAWKVPEFNKMVESLRLTDEEVSFLLTGR